MRILLFYQHIEREKDAILSIKKELVKLNHNVYLFSINFEYVKAISFAKKIKIDAIIMPWMYHDRNYSLMAPFIKNNNKLLLINLHSEQISSPFSRDILLPNGENSKNYIYHFVWGDYFKNKLKEIGVKEELIKITGNCRTDSIFNKRISRDVVSKTYELDLKKKWILFSENRGWVYLWNNKLKEDRLKIGKTIEDLDSDFKLNKRSLEKTYEDINTLNSNFFEKYELIYRPHPGTICPVKLNEKIKIINSESIYYWLSCVDINIVWSSTTAFESDAMGIATFIYEPIPNEEKFRTDGIKKYVKIHSFNEISEELIRFSLKYQKTKKNYEQYIGKITGKNCYLIANEVHKLSKSTNLIYPKKISINYKHILKRFIFEKIVKLFTKLNILILLRYPRTAYSSYKDIPWIFGKEIK